MPSSAELRRLSLNIVEIREELANERVREVGTENRTRHKAKPLKANVCLLHYRIRDIKEVCRFFRDFPTSFEPTIPW